MKSPLRILYLEDNANDVVLVQRTLKKAGFDADLRIVDSRSEFLEALDQQPFDLILSDSNVLGFDGPEALKLARAKLDSIPFIFVSDHVRLESTHGAGYVKKADLHKLPETIRSVLQSANPSPTAPAASTAPSAWFVSAMEQFVSTVQQLSLARDLNSIMTIVRHAARELTGADGATFVLRENGNCHYADEEAIAPLWKGKRFPMTACISGWAMLNKQSAVIEDIYQDSRIPADAYRTTFVKSLVMVPIRRAKPIGAIGVYWATHHRSQPEEVKLLQALADSTSIAMENVELYTGLERTVAERTARLQTANEELEAFSYSVSHDLRAPLRHISGYAHLLEESCQGEKEETRRHLTAILDATGRMNQLIEDLLSFSHASRTELHRERVNMNALVDEVRRELAPDVQGRVIRWTIESLPVVEGDAALLKQVWFNLLSNAIKYTRTRPEAEIRVGAHQREPIEFFVQDNGVGFDPAYASKLFGVFQRLHSTKEFEGTGIGLANVRRIIHRHGGTTRAEGKVGHGATFYFTLPAPASS